MLLLLPLLPLLPLPILRPSFNFLSHCWLASVSLSLSLGSIELFFGSLVEPDDEIVAHVHGKIHSQQLD